MGTVNMETGEITEEEIAEQMSPDEDLEPETEDAPEPEPEPEAAPAPAEPPSDSAMEERYKKVQTAAKGYATNVGRIMDEHATDLLMCPLCSPGATPAFVNKYDAGRVPDDVKAVVLAFLGFAQEQDYEHDPETQECPSCKGKGLTSTGSRVPNNETRECVRCHGFGYTPPPGDAAATGGTVSVLHAPAGQTLEPLDGETIDVSGEPRILPDGRLNPNFQKWPQYKVQVPPWGNTIGLTAQDVAS